MGDGGKVVYLSSIGTFFRPSDLMTAPNKTFHIDESFLLKDIANDEWFDTMSFADRQVVSKYFNIETRESKKMRKGGKAGHNWIKMSEEDLKEHYDPDDDFVVTDIWHNTEGDAEFYRIETEKGEPGATLLGELGDAGETLIEDYPTLAKARARATELVRIAKSGKGYYGKKMSGGGLITDWNGTKVTITKGDDPARDIGMLMEMSDTFGGLDTALARLTKTYPIASIKIDLKD